MTGWLAFKDKATPSFCLLPTLQHPPLYGGMQLGFSHGLVIHLTEEEHVIICVSWVIIAVMCINLVIIYVRGFDHEQGTCECRQWFRG